uniref:ATP-dependent Clp protease adaptor ClpS n=1 Tax=Synechococcus sp. UW106 TaxID=368495 RepID=UPI0010BDE20D|nr:ATP-dependent Clp protease adaptor ClpS [Synechococcus sp. UW106]
MARLAPGHFSFHPDDLNGREMVTTVRTATDGELNVEFKATIHMEMTAFQELAEKKFKGVYWLTDDPHIEQHQERQSKYLKEREESLERVATLEERIKEGKSRRMYDVVIPKVDHLNCEQMAKKLMLAMPWMDQKEASELAWRIHENGEATVFTTTDEKMKGIVGSLLLSSIKRLKSTGSRIETVEEST